MDVKEIIAVLLYKIGVKPQITTFIDEETLVYGYGKLHHAGFWEYNIPNKYITPKPEDL